MSSKKSPPKSKKLDENTLNKLYYVRFLFGILAGSLSGLIPPFFASFSLILLILFLFLSNNFMKTFILKNLTEPPLKHGIGIYILSWLFFFAMVATIIRYTIGYPF